MKIRVMQDLCCAAQLCVLAAPDLFADVVHVDPLDPAPVLGGHRDDALRVVVERTDSTDRVSEVATRDGGGAHVHVLHDPRIDAQRP